MLKQSSEKNVVAYFYNGNGIRLREIEFRHKIGASFFPAPICGRFVDIDSKSEPTCLEVSCSQ